MDTVWMQNALINTENYTSGQNQTGRNSLLAWRQFLVSLILLLFILQNIFNLESLVKDVIAFS